MWKKSLTPLNKGKESEVFQFSPDAQTKSLAVKVINLKNLSDNRRHRYCSHILKSRWITMKRRGAGRSSSASSIHKRCGSDDIMHLIPDEVWHIHVFYRHVFVGNFKVVF